MLEHFGFSKAANHILLAISDVLSQKKLRTRDLGGKASTVQCGKAVAERLR